MGTPIGRTARPDVQAAATVIASRDDNAFLNLRGAYLSRSSLNNANLSVDLTGASLNSADLSGSWLVGADFTGASLIGANLTGSDLIDAHFDGALLDGATWPWNAAVPVGWA